VLGTAGYLSPEQASGRRAGPASDRYSLAVVAYELLSGRRPFESRSPTAEAAAHVNASVPSIVERCEGLPAAVDGVFRRALAKNPDARFGTARELVAELRDALTRPAGTTAVLAPPRARPQPGPGPRRYVIPLALLVAAGAIGALVATLVTRGGGSAPTVVTHTVAGPGGTTTVRQTVTQQQTTAPAPPPPPPPPPPVVGANGHTLNDRGFSLMQNGDYAGALPPLQQAVQSLSGVGPGDPYEGYANYNLGYTLYKLGRCSAAVPYLRRAEHLEPDRSEPRDIRKRAQHC
jgi:tetratricopeptide (TPR) repeat protein